jgi:hypothetical protein
MAAASSTDFWVMEQCSTFAETTTVFQWFGKKSSLTMQEETFKSTILLLHEVLNFARRQYFQISEIYAQLCLQHLRLKPEVNLKNI